MKKVILLATIFAVLLGASLVSASSCGSRRAQGPDTLKINTTDLCKDIVGFNGPVPVEISVFQGVVTDIKMLPNQETPRFLKMVEASGLAQKLVGKTLDEAKDVELDAVTGATYTSNALIKNIRAGLKEVK